MTRHMPGPLAASAALVLALGGIRAMPSPVDAYAPAAHVEPVGQRLHVSPRVTGAPPIPRESYTFAGPFAWPLHDVIITDPYGPRPAGAPCAGCLAVHMGLDFGGEGQPIHAIASGVVIETGGPYAGYGNYVIIAHDVAGERFESLYAHMVDGSRLVGVGQPVEVGQPLGLVGATGNVTGPHLHLEVHVGGVQVDPWAFLKARVR